MPDFQSGDMWSAYAQAGLFLITTNATITRNGRLVMGRGIAKQVRDRFPSLAAALGQQIQQQCGSLGTYGLLISPRWPTAKLGAFQVKYHFGETADLALIQQSAAALHRWATAHPDVAIHRNMPGIDCQRQPMARLPRTAVLLHIQQLPHNVTIWEYPHQPTSA